MGPLLPYLCYCYNCKLRVSVRLALRCYKHLSFYSKGVLLFSVYSIAMLLSCSHACDVALLWYTTHHRRHFYDGLCTTTVSIASPVLTNPIEWHTLWGLLAQEMLLICPRIRLQIKIIVYSLPLIALFTVYYYFSSFRGCSCTC